MSGLVGKRKFQTDDSTEVAYRLLADAHEYVRDHVHTNGIGNF